MATENNQEVEQHIEREVQRRVARAARQQGDQIAELRSIISQCQSDLIRQRELIARLTSEPLTFGTLIKVHGFPDPSRFKVNDEIVVTDPDSPHYCKGGRIVSDPPIDDEGYCRCLLTNETELRLGVGLEGKAPAQVRLTMKDDGTFAVVNLDGKAWEVRGVPDLGLQIGDTVKVKPDTKAVISRGYELKAGPICHVVAVNGNAVEVYHKGERQLVYNPRNFELQENDRVACDPTMFCVIEKLPKEDQNRFNLTQDLGVTWDDIGGLDGAKQEMRDALELPFQQPDLFKHYGIEPLRGILLYGPPGCGKTLLARAAAASIAATHGKTNAGGYIYVKSPEILDKWVGNTERMIRELFERGRQHFRDHGYKAILAFDEADAIMPQRGSRRSSDVADTIVPMFLGEMDGIDSKQTQENPIVVLMTNRADILDPAVTRPGRISRHIKIDRPSDSTAIDILSIHTKSVPFKDDKKRDALLAITVTDIFSKSRLLYRINNEHDFTLGDCVNGAMLQNIAEVAKMNALHRDLAENTQTGVAVDDFRTAVQKIYRQQRGVNHSYDIQDFCDRLGLQAASAKVERCFGAA